MRFGSQYLNKFLSDLSQGCESLSTWDTYENNYSDLCSNENRQFVLDIHNMVTTGYVFSVLDCRNPPNNRLKQILKLKSVLKLNWLCYKIANTICFLYNVPLV